MNPHFHSKTLDIKINPFVSKFTDVSTKISPFLLEKANPGFPKKNTPLFVNLDACGKVVWVRELGCNLCKNSN